MSKEIIEKIRSAEDQAAAIRRDAEEKAREKKIAAEAEAERIVAAARESGEDRLKKIATEHGIKTGKAAEDGRRDGAYESARQTAEALDNLEAAVAYVIGGLTE